MTAPSPPSLPPTPSTGPQVEGARTWAGLPPHPEAHLPAQLVGLVVAIGAILVLVLPHPGLVTWGLVAAASFAVGVVGAIALPPLRIFDASSGLVVGAVVLIVELIAGSLLIGATGVLAPFGLVLVLPAVAVGLDWRRIDRIRPVLILSIAVAVIGAIEGSALAIGGAVVVVALAVGTLALLEADRRAGLPQVQQDASIGQARTDDLLTTLLIAAAVALVAALVLSVPSCSPRHRSSSSSSLGSGGGSAGGSGVGSGAPGGPGSLDHVYVPDPSGRFLVPGDAADGASGSGEAIPLPDEAEDLSRRGGTITGGDGTQVQVTPRADGDLDVTVRPPEGPPSRYRYHPNADGTTTIDRLAPDGSVSRRWTYDPQGKIATEAGAGSASDRATPKDRSRKERSSGLAGVARVVALLLLLAAVAALGAWLWRRRTPKPEVDPAAPPWAIALAARLAKEGAARGRPRRRGEPIVAYGWALADEALPDERVARIAEVVSDALFSGRPTPEGDRLWAEATFDEVVEAHPPPSRGERRRAKAGAAS
ncbi:MAG: hypothetical protein U0P45_06520 [Acidimicrobiales bacterium]